MLLPADKLRSRIDEIAAEVDRDYGGRKITAGVVLKGAFVFAADLIRRLSTPVEIEFVCLASYNDGTVSSGCIQVASDVTGDVLDREVLIIEDVVDTGRSMDFLIEHLYDLGASDVKLCVLLDKPSRREVDLEADFVGFVIPDVFVVGFGIDHAQCHRNLPDICQINE